MTTTTQWAENEVRLAKEREHKNSSAEDAAIFGGYVDACYDSALKTYKCMAEDGHSGMSWGITKNILIKLLNDVPLGPIEEDEDCWSGQNTLDKSQQCTRRFSLFRDKQEDGTWKYHDIDLVAVDDVYPDHISAVGSKFGDSLCEKLFGKLVTFPYYPPVHPYRVRRIEINGLTRNGNDIVFVPFVKKPNGEIVEVNKFYEDKWQDPIEIGFEFRMNPEQEKEFDEKKKYSDSRR